MHSVVNLPWLDLSSVKVMSFHSVGWASLISSRKCDWKWTGIFSAMSGRRRVSLTSSPSAGLSVAMSTPSCLARSSRTAAPYRRSAG